MRHLFILFSFCVAINAFAQNTAKESISTTSYTWYPFTGSKTIHGVLNSFSKPLQYNPALQTITFFHNASATYSAFPSTSLTAGGAVVAMISTNFGTSWDSACVWSDNSLSAINPQGAIYNPLGNTNTANAYLVGSGPVQTGTNYVGNWYASKQLTASNFNYSASATPGAMQFMPNTSPFGSLNKHDLSWSSFSSTDDGKVRSLAIIDNDINATNNVGIGLRGALIATGNFNSGVFNWTSDSLIPPTILRTDGTKQLYSKPLMAWSQDGVIGYVIFIGSQAGSTQYNQGWQPIIYKTSNSGVSWALTPGIDFNTATSANSYVKYYLGGVTTNTVLKVPYFNVNEGIDATVDINGKLHIATTIASTKSTHVDSLEFVSRFMNGGESYVWAHTPGAKPYLYDFIGDGSTWSYALIDSLTTEAPGSKVGDPGYNYNPWDPDPAKNNSKITSSSRIQLSRTPDSKFIVYTWAESDTNFTTNSSKWNEIPNIMARCVNVSAGYGLSGKINVTKTFGGNLNVVSKAMFHYSSPITRTVSISIYTISIALPITVSNNFPYSQLNHVTHWFAGGKLDFDLFYPWQNTILSVKGQELADNINAQIKIFPNPANDVLTIEMELFKETEFKLKIFNNLSQLVREEDVVFKDKSIAIKTEDLKSGVYFLNLNSHKFGTVSKRFVIAR